MNGKKRKFLLTGQNGAKFETKNSYECFSGTKNLSPPKNYYLPKKQKVIFDHESQNDLKLSKFPYFPTRILKFE